MFGGSTHRIIFSAPGDGPFYLINYLIQILFDQIIDKILVKLLITPAIIWKMKAFVVYYFSWSFKICDPFSPPYNWIRAQRAMLSLVIHIGLQLKTIKAQL